MGWLTADGADVRFRGRRELPHGQRSDSCLGSIDDEERANLEFRVAFLEDADDSLLLYRLQLVVEPE